MARNNMVIINSDSSSSSDESDEIAPPQHVEDSESESDEVQSLNSDDSDYDVSMRTFVIHLLKHVLHHGRVVTSIFNFQLLYAIHNMIFYHVSFIMQTIPAEFVRIHNLVQFNQVGLNCPRTGHQLACTLHKHGDARRQDVAISHVTIRGNLRWFRNVNRWRTGDYIKFTKRVDGDRLVFDVETLG